MIFLIITIFQRCHWLRVRSEVRLAINYLFSCPMDACGQKYILYFSAWFLSCCLCSVNCNWKMKMLLRWTDTSWKIAKSLKLTGWIICISWLFWSYFRDKCIRVTSFCVSYLISYLSYLFFLLSSYAVLPPLFCLWFF